MASGGRALSARPLRNHDALRRDLASRGLSTGVAMLRSDLVWRIFEQNPHFYLQDVERIVDAIFDEIIASLARGKRVELRGFGRSLSKSVKPGLAVTQDGALESLFQERLFLVSRRERK